MKQLHTYTGEITVYVFGSVYVVTHYGEDTLGIFELSRYFIRD